MIISEFIHNKYIPKILLWMDLIWIGADFPLDFSGCYRCPASQVQALSRCTYLDTQQVDRSNSDPIDVSGNRIPPTAHD